MKILIWANVDVDPDLFDTMTEAIDVVRAGVLKALSAYGEATCGAMVGSGSVDPPDRSDWQAPTPYVPTPEGYVCACGDELPCPRHFPTALPPVDPWDR